MVSFPVVPFPPRGRLGWLPPLRRYNGTIRLLAAHPASLGLSFAQRYRLFCGRREVSQVPGESARSCPALRPRWKLSTLPCCTPRKWGVAVSPGSRHVGVPHSSSLTLSVLRCCLPPIQRRRLPRPSSFGAQSHGPFARCLRFAGFVASSHARLASTWWPTFGRRDWLPAGPHREVSDFVYFIFLLTQAWPGALHANC
jgi:hypothetical protein